MPGERTREVMGSSRPPRPGPLTVVVGVHLAEDFLRPLFRGRLVLWHLHHGRNHLVNSLGGGSGRRGVSSLPEPPTPNLQEPPPGVQRVLLHPARCSAGHGGAGSGRAAGEGSGS